MSVPLSGLLGFIGFLDIFLFFVCACVVCSCIHDLLLASLSSVSLLIIPVRSRTLLSLSILLANTKYIHYTHLPSTCSVWDRVFETIERRENFDCRCDCNTRPRFRDRKLRLQVQVQHREPGLGLGPGAAQGWETPACLAAFRPACSVPMFPVPSASS